MNFARALPLLLLLATGCSREPTPLDVPSGAAEVERFFFLDGRAYQTQFTLNIAFPESPAVGFYENALPASWVKCTWGSEWSRFVDAQGAEPYTVHQQLHMWVNPELERTLMLSSRYHSAEDCCEVPDNHTQRVVVVEYLRTSVADTIKQLKLQCPPGAGL